MSLLGRLLKHRKGVSLGFIYSILGHLRRTSYHVKCPQKVMVRKDLGILFMIYLVGGSRDFPNFVQAVVSELLP